jgi:hypothetical protein
MKKRKVPSRYDTKLQASSPPVSSKVSIETIAALHGTVLVGKPEFKHLKEYLLERDVDEKIIESLTRIIKDQDGFNAFRKKIKENRLEEFICEEKVLRSASKEIVEIIENYKGREFVLKHYPATRDKLGNTEVGIDILKKGAREHCGHIYFYYRWDDTLEGYYIYFGWITTIIHQDTKRLGIAKQAIGLVGQLFPPGSIELYPHTTDKETIAKGPEAEAAVYKNLAGAGGFTEVVKLNDPQIAPILKINPFDNSRFVFRKKRTTTKYGRKRDK